MKVSIKDISEASGFSSATISNALNHKRGVNKETSQKIFEIAKELGYVNDQKITKIKFVIYKKNGLIIDDSQFFPAVIEGVERQARKMGYETVFCNLNARSPDIKDQINEILEDRTSAVILLATELMEEDFQMFKDPKCYFIILDGWSDTITFDGVLISNTDSALKATEYLIRKGHRKIGYLKGKFRIKAFSYRAIGYRRAITKYGLKQERRYEIPLRTTTEGAYKDMSEYLETTKDLPTAFFADNDVIALGAIKALQEHGYRIPEDISVIGFDDLPFCEISYPRLTTIRVPKQEMGEIAVRRLVDHIKLGCKIKAKIQVCTDFVERDSVRDIN